MRSGAAQVRSGANGGTRGFQGAPARCFVTAWVIAIASAARSALDPSADAGVIIALVNPSGTVATVADVGRRESGLDTARSGVRFRVNEVYCRDDTWRATVEALIDTTDTVLMDLRAFTEHHDGCRFEIQELFHLVPLRRVVFLVDSTTAEPYLEQVMREARAGMSASSPNRDGAGGELQIIRAGHGTGAQLKALLKAVCEAAASARTMSSFRAHA